MRGHHLFTTPFGFDTTADEVLRGVDLVGKRAIATGAASGIGAETAGALACAGAEVTLAVRNVDPGSQAGVHSHALDGGDAWAPTSLAARRYLQVSALHAGPPSQLGLGRAEPVPGGRNASPFPMSGARLR